MGDATSHDEPLIARDVKYSSLSDLNTLQTCVFKRSSNRNKKLWLVYIHGGAWRAPDIDAASFNALQSALLKRGAARYLDGLASINYRLSPYPSHNTNPSNPHDPARNAIHPDHISDVCSAIAFLQHKYDFGDQYILIGHSCGATLAFQVAMARHWTASTSATPPICIVGVEGIYDIPTMLETYKDISAYREFVVSAFGEQPDLWKSVSPAEADLTSSWANGKRVMLVHSEADELLTSEQLDLMRRALYKQDWSSRGEKVLTTIMLQDLKHDEVWEKPEQLARVIMQVIEELSG